MRPIDADKLEREGWMLCRTRHDGLSTISYETKKPADFPTIEPEQKKGRWIDEPFIGDLVVHRCSVCMRTSGVGSGHKWFHFCPNCGAKMEVKE